MLKPYLTTENGILFSEDCLELMSHIRDNSFNCVFADPPFNIGKNYGNGYKDDIPEKQYIKWCKEWLHELCRTLKPGGALFVYGTPKIAMQFAWILNESLNFRHWIALTMKGTYHRGKRLYPAHYALLYYTKGEPAVFNKLRTPIQVCRKCKSEIKDYGGYRNKLNEEGINLSDFWDDTSPNRHKKFKVREGVNELKLMIPERAILLSTNINDIVFDPFGGGGSTYQAAELNNRKWVGSELYDCQHIKKRLNEQFNNSDGHKPSEELKTIFNTNVSF